MSTALRISMNPVPKRTGQSAAPERVLVSGGAAVVLGSVAAEDGQAMPVVPSDRTLFAPRAATIAAGGGLWVSDTGHHRLLGWTALPDENNEPAAWLIGQPTFRDEGRNGKGEPGPATLNVPTGIAACGRGLAVADGWNHRVLIWHEVPRRHNQPADLVLGQKTFHSVEPNHGEDRPAADTLFWPFGVAWDGAHLWVADTGNRRVLVWEGLPTCSGQSADMVLGQNNFSCRDENAGGAPSTTSMRWPHGITFLGNRVCVADAGNSRVMVWRQTPSNNGAACDAILGQRLAAAADHNQGDYWPDAAALNMPYGVTTVGDWLVVADTANSRLLAWRSEDLCGYGAPARRLAGQPDWHSKGDNRWQPATRDSLCWPYGLGSESDHAIIADAGNNRVLLWRWNAEMLS